MEVEVARLAAERMTPDLLAALQQTIDRYEQAAGDVEIRVSQDLEFHQLLARASRSSSVAIRSINCSNRNRLTENTPTSR